MAKPKKVKKDEVHICYFCDEPIDNLMDLVIQQVPLQCKDNKIRNYNRKLHVECMLKFRDNRMDVDLKAKENSDWDELYQYVKREIFQLEPSHKLDQHTIKRLLGLRVGKYMPQANNVRLLKKGYSYREILITFKLCKNRIVSYLNSTDFADSQHKTNAMMKIIESEINDVHKRLQKQAESNAKLEKENKDELFGGLDYEEMYKQKREKEKNKDREVNGINLLFGGKL